MNLPPDNADAAYKERMERRKAIQDKRIAETVGEQGLVIVHTGAGKGKTTAALGMVLRSQYFRHSRCSQQNLHPRCAGIVGVHQGRCG